MANPFIREALLGTCKVPFQKLLSRKRRRGHPGTPLRWAPQAASKPDLHGGRRLGSPQWCPALGFLSLGHCFPCHNPTRPQAEPSGPGGPKGGWGTFGILAKTPATVHRKGPLHCTAEELLSHRRDSHRPTRRLESDSRGQVIGPEAKTLHDEAGSATGSRISKFTS